MTAATVESSDRQGVNCLTSLRFVLEGTADLESQLLWK
jgi:hypothetical protein